MKSKYLTLFAIFLIVLGLILSKSPPRSQLLSANNNKPTPTPKILKPIDRYEPPTIAAAASYTVIFVGDSMTERLGENFDALRPDLKKYYPDKVFGLFNYGFGSTSILSVDDRLNHDSVYQGALEGAERVVVLWINLICELVWEQASTDGCLNCPLAWFG